MLNSARPSPLVAQCYTAGNKIGPIEVGSIIMWMPRIFFALLVAIGLASAQTDLSLVLGWTPQGPYAPYIVALEQGYFAAEGINLKIDRGYGSADSVSKVAMGTYEWPK